MECKSLRTEHMPECAECDLVCWDGVSVGGAEIPHFLRWIGQQGKLKE